MAGENPGVYMLQGGSLTPLATVKGSKGDKGDQGGQGIQGIQGLSATGVVVSDTAPANPTRFTVWLNTSGL